MRMGELQKVQSLLRMELFILDNGSTKTEMDSAVKCGQTEADTKEAGKTIKPTDKES